MWGAAKFERLIVVYQGGCKVVDNLHGQKIGAVSNVSRSFHGGIFIVVLAIIAIAVLAQQERTCVGIRVTPIRLGLNHQLHAMCPLRAVVNAAR